LWNLSGELLKQELMLISGRKPVVNIVDNESIRRIINMAAKKDKNVPTEVTTGTVNSEKTYLVPVEVVVRTTYYLKAQGDNATDARDHLENQIGARFSNVARGVVVLDSGSDPLRKSICDEIESNASLSTDTLYEFSVGFDGVIHQR
jgi:hypothetical protein